MLEYRERNISPIPSSQPGAAGKEEKWQALALQYDLGEMYLDDDDDERDQTVEEEFSAYVTAPLVRGGVDLVKFWQVCLIFCV